MQGFPQLTCRAQDGDYPDTMFERSRANASARYTLPQDAETRRMAINTLAFRALSHEREAEIHDRLGDDGSGLLSEMMATAANETGTQLMLTERLLNLGWDWERILAAVWHNEEFLRESAVTE